MVGFNRNSILALVYQRKVKGFETSWSDFEKEFGPWARGSRSKQCGKGTFLKYKSQLEVEGKLRKKLSDKTRRPVYYIPEEFEREAELANKLHELIHGADKSIDYFGDALIKMSKELAEKLAPIWSNHFKSWLIKKGHEELSKKFDKERVLEQVKIKIVDKSSLG